MKKLIQPFHLVTMSPWPILMSFSVMSLLIGIMNWFNNFNYYLMLYSLIISILCMYQWWRDVIRESTYQGFHTIKVISGLKMGMILFIISEIFFFISIFWCYFHMFLSPSIEIGMIWPPKNILSFNPYNIPLLNTIILLSSGITITWCHYSILLSKKLSSFISLLYTIILGIVFTLIQYMEYDHASFTMADSVYGSIFFMSTGFHGLHVIIGTLFLMINLIRINNNNYSSIHHFGFESAAWYWHFVDVVWLFLYLLIYVWSFN
uniref:Cytochrome c oxidase subunit 3 n=1 Tax=Tetrastichus howardi TaxID=2848231 RepID=A0A8F5GB25_9HYME|nr:cytochrome c oxidase subunit III [Tetrastichus howardi]QXM14783.1 cytochrome c oxidase subunit III [Tetrastichus howardi]